MGHVLKGSYRHLFAQLPKAAQEAFLWTAVIAGDPATGAKGLQQRIQDERAKLQEAVNEALKLESALARLRNEHIVAILHYAPIHGTVEGEPRDIYPFLGCSRLEDPLTRFPVSVVFHGHAHHGTPEGRTRTNVPVFNVSASLMRERFPDRPFQLVEIGAGAPAAGDRRVGADRRTAEITS